MWGPSSSCTVKLASRNTPVSAWPFAVVVVRGRRVARGMKGGKERRAGTPRESTAAPLCLRADTVWAPRFLLSCSPQLSHRSAWISGAAPHRGPPRGPTGPALVRAQSRPEPGPTGPCPLILSSLNCGNWHWCGAPDRVAPGWSVPTRCASRLAQRATRQGSRSRAEVTASSLRGPPRTRGATSAATSSGASCARACSARVSSGPTRWRERNGWSRGSTVAAVQVVCVCGGGGSVGTVPEDQVRHICPIWEECRHMFYILRGPPPSPCLGHNWVEAVVCK